MKIEYNILYHLDCSDGTKIAGIDCSNLFKDGRITSLLLEHILSRKFEDFYLSESKGSNFDAVVSSKKIELKTITNNGLKLIQSKMLGVGRKFNNEDYLYWLSTLDSFVVCDITSFPDIYVRMFKTHTFKQKTYSIKKAKEFLGGVIVKTI